MPIKTIKGLIKRRLLVNYQVDPDVIQNVIPPPFKPKIIKGNSIIGVCLIRLEDIRPSLLASLSVGISSENAAHRIAVEWVEEGIKKEGVYIFRRDTNSKLNTLVGGRLFPGVHKFADFEVSDCNGMVEFSMVSRDKEAEVHISGNECEALPEISVFSSIDEISAFFKGGEDGYSPNPKQNCVQGLCLQTDNWNMKPFMVDNLKTTYMQNKLNIPKEELQFDSVVIMRDVDHTWKKIPSIKL
ncbi:hypothetical protein GMD78_20580 [Ornithinibacillus sp. L9]|uniref:Uncharacterized protein n=1 Tax=Ornithinibacillus caprae TaxID=2678566 RepID=A0A6N8FPA5_9BACI|nr:DUF2071 domain-containing protein [Ornithinibacillus caprae]MUK90756.1 hypothetical protein [Ornithinibacillus caprae]